MAEQWGAQATMDPANAPLATVIDAALDLLLSQGVARALVLMSDLPRLCRADLECILGALARHDAAIAPDRAGAGTNGLALRLEPRYRTCFGHSDSLEQFLRDPEFRVEECTPAQPKFESPERLTGGSA